MMMTYDAADEQQVVKLVKISSSCLSPPLKKYLDCIDYSTLYSTIPTPGDKNLYHTTISKKNPPIFFH